MRTEDKQILAHDIISVYVCFTRCMKNVLGTSKHPIDIYIYKIDTIKMKKSKIP